MKQVNILALLFLYLFVLKSNAIAQTAPADVFISEYIEGSSNNKAIEIYNGTSSAINLTDGNYVIQFYFNGSTSNPTTITLTGIIPANGVFVLANAAASFASAPYVNQTSAASFYNGDDAILLKKGGAIGTVLDAIGKLGADPGTEWGTGLTSTADNTLRRKAGICSGDTGPYDDFDPAVQWDGYAQDEFTGLGSHTANCSTTGTGINVSPASLSFTATTGSPSGQQSYSLQGNGLSDDVVVTAPANFEVAALSGGSFSNSITIPASTAKGGTTIYVRFNPASSGNYSGNITNTSGSTSAAVIVQGSASSGSTTYIYTIQGSGAASPQKGNVVTTEGVVTADFQAPGQLSGFYLQDMDGDGDTTTSDGIFIFDTTHSVSVGDFVRLTGTIDEYFDLTEIKTVSALTVLSAGNTLPQPVTIQLPVAAKGDLEKYESMLATFPQTLTVSENFVLGRYGELTLSSGGRLFTPTNVVDPNDDPASGTTSSGNTNVAEVQSQQDLNSRRSIILDDGSNIQNPSVIPFVNPADTTLRTGTTVDNLTGVLTYSFGEYLIEATQSPQFNYALRPEVPSVGAANIKVGSFNVLNYFNGNGTGGGFPTERGANTLTEFNRQRAKIIAAIKALDADVLGLTEIENDGNRPNSAIADLVSGLNNATGDSTYTYIPDPTGANGNTGTDAIKVALIYKHAIVTPVGAAKADTAAIHNRPPLAQTFKLNINNEKLTVIINHFKSKSCTGASGANADQGDGQSCYNMTRAVQADSLLSFIAEMQTISGDSDIIAVGDFNAYDEEDPIDQLRAGGLTDILPGTYSYVFDAQSGSLDHGFVTGSLASGVTGAAKWHINADEPVVKDYNQEFNPDYAYSPGPYRSSDHDPVLAGLYLQPVNEAPIIAITSPQNGTMYNAGDTIIITANATDRDGSIAKVEFYKGDTLLGKDETAPYQYLLGGAEAGNYSITAKAYDDETNSAVSAPVSITVAACTGSGWIAVDMYTGIPGSKVTDLTSSSKYPNQPYLKLSLSRFELPSNIGDRYGIRVRGYICPPLTGKYVFSLASDENSELWLSTGSDTAGIRKIAFVNGKTAPRQWKKYPSQTSDSIWLVKGKQYFVQVLYKESTGTDNMAVRWRLPNGKFEGPIPASRLSPYPASSAASPTAFTPGYSLQPDVNSQMEMDIVDGLDVKVSPNPSQSNFTLMVRSNKSEAIALSVTDIVGRIIEVRNAKIANTTITLGGTYKPGVYLVEIVQGDEHKVLKLVKQ